MKPRLKYHQPTPIPRAKAVRIFEEGKTSEVCGALVSLAFFESDWRWVQDQCLGYLGAPVNPQIKQAAIVSLGHVARCNGKLDVSKVLPVLKRLQKELRYSGRVEDAMEDIRIHLQTKVNRAGSKSHSRPAGGAKLPESANNKNKRKQVEVSGS